MINDGELIYTDSITVKGMGARRSQEGNGGDGTGRRRGLASVMSLRGVG